MTLNIFNEIEIPKDILSDLLSKTETWFDGQEFKLVETKPSEDLHTETGWRWHTLIFTTLGRYYQAPKYIKTYDTEGLVSWPDQGRTLKCREVSRKQSIEYEFVEKKYKYYILSEEQLRELIIDKMCVEKAEFYDYDGVEFERREIPEKEIAQEFLLYTKYDAGKMK